jgi:hypothetical protein
MAKFHEVIRPDGHASSVVLELLVLRVYELVVCASLHNVGLESLESGLLVRGEMSWVMQRKEGGGRATK